MPSKETAVFTSPFPDVEIPDVSIYDDLFAGLTVEQISDLDLSYTPPLGSPWDAVHVATQTWSRTHTPAGVLA